MPRYFHPLFQLLARATQQELIEQIEYLKAENRMLRQRLPKCIIDLTPAERAKLVKLGTKVGPALRELITIVTHRTFRRWVAKSQSTGKTQRKVDAKPGRPRLDEDIRSLVCRMARENGWGYTRILGELKKLGIHSISRSTVRNILIEGGFDPGPKRGEGSWDEFIKIHIQTLWACDFISKKIVTPRGLVDYFILFFIHIQSHRVIAMPAIAHPDGQWTAQQARNFVMQVEDQGQQVTHLIRDMDGKFEGGFDFVLKTDDVKVIKVGPRKPNLNAYAERFVQTIQSECLDHFIVFGEKHLNYLVNEFVDYYHEERPHQGINNRLILGPAPPNVPERAPPVDDVVCHQRLGGLLNHYQRKAA